MGLMGGCVSGPKQGAPVALYEAVSGVPKEPASGVVIKLGQGLSKKTALGARACAARSLSFGTGCSSNSGKARESWKPGAGAGMPCRAFPSAAATRGAGIEIGASTHVSSNRLASTSAKPIAKLCAQRPSAELGGSSAMTSCAFAKQDCASAFVRLLSWPAAKTPASPGQPIFVSHTRRRVASQGNQLIRLPTYCYPPKKLWTRGSTRKRTQLASCKNAR